MNDLRDVFIWFAYLVIGILCVGVYVHDKRIEELEIAVHTIINALCDEEYQLYTCTNKATGKPWRTK